MWRCEDVEMWICVDVWRCVDVEMCSCGDVDVEMWMWRFEDE